MSKSYNELRFTDDFLFCKILESNEALCRELLELILKIRISRMVYTSKQKTIELTSDGRGIRLDVYVEDDTQTVYNIEMQTTTQKNLPKRSRYYQGMIDLNLIERGSDYKELKKSYVIFICLTDPFGKGLHIYTFENQCKELLGLSLGDETTKVFINAAGIADDVSADMKAFLDYLTGKSVNNDFVNRIEKEVSKARTHEEWRLEYMTLLQRDRQNREEGRIEGRAEGIVAGQLQQLNSLLEKGIITLEEAYGEVKDQMTLEEFEIALKEVHTAIS